MKRTVWLAALIAVVLGTIPVGARILVNTIGATAAVVGRGRVVRGTVLVGCTAGEQVQLTLTLTQNLLNRTV